MKFLCKVKCKSTNEVYSIYVPYGHPRYALEQVSESTNININDLEIVDSLTKPDANGERYSITTISELRVGTYFKVVNKDLTVGKTVYVRDNYDRSEKKYYAYKFLDVNDGRSFKPMQMVCIDFTF